MFQRVQINTLQTLRVKTRLDVEGVISGSSQVNKNTITNFDSNVKTKLDFEGVISGSSQVNKYNY